MKKQLFFIAGLCLFLNAFSQVEQGKILLGASTPVSGGIENLFFVSRGGGGAGLSFNTQKDVDGNKAKTTALGLSPIVGYAVADNLLLGLGLNLLSSTSKGDGNSDEKFTVTVFSLEPQARYYFPVAKAVPFLEAGVSYGQLKTKTEGSGFFDGEDKTNITTFRGGAGLALFFNPSASADFTLSYQGGNMKDPDVDDSKIKASAFGLNIGFSWFLK